MDKQTLLQNAIDWNIKEFYRALKENRLKDAQRFLDNTERLAEDEEESTGKGS